jgi:hypothetical protein
MQQAEMETDDFGFQLFDQLAHRGIEWRPVGRIDRRRRVEAELLIIGRKPLPPSGLAASVGIDHFVAEEVHVDRSRHALAQDIDLFARLLHRQHRAGQ